MVATREPSGLIRVRLGMPGRAQLPVGCHSGFSRTASKLVTRPRLVFRQTMFCRVPYTRSQATAAKDRSPAGSDSGTVPIVP